MYPDLATTNHVQARVERLVGDGPRRARRSARGWPDCDKVASGAAAQTRTSQPRPGGEGLGGLAITRQLSLSYLAAMSSDPVCTDCDHKSTLATTTSPPVITSTPPPDLPHPQQQVDPATFSPPKLDYEVPRVIVEVSTACFVHDERDELSRC